MLTWGPWPAAPSCLSSWWPPCLWCLHLCLPRHPAVSPTLQQPPLQRASCHSLLCSQPWQRKAVLELPVVYLNRCREKINTHDMNKAAWLNSLYLNVFYLLATDGASYQMPAGLHDATQLAFPAGLCSVGKRVAGGGQFHLPWQEVKIWRWMLGSLEVKLIFCLWSANQLQIRDLSVQFLADKVNLKWTAKKRGGWQSLALSSTVALSADELLLRFDILDLSWAAYAECVKVFSVSVWTGRDCFWWLHILFSLHQIGCVPSLVWMLPPLDFQADRPQEVAVAFRLLRQIRPAAFIWEPPCCSLSAWVCTKHTKLTASIQIDFMNANLRTMARSSFLPLLLVAALFVVPAFVPSPAPRSVPNTAATSAAAGLLPLLVVQPAMAEEGRTWATSCIFESLQRENKYTWYEQSSLIEFTVFECILFACYRWCIISDACRTTWCHPAGLSCWSLQCWQARCWWWAISSSLARSENLKMNVRKSWGEAHFLSLISESAADSWFERSISSGQGQPEMNRQKERSLA